MRTRTPILFRVAVRLITLPKIVLEVGLFNGNSQRIGRRAPDKLVVRLTRPARQSIHSRYDRRRKAFFLFERPSPSLLDGHHGDRRSFVPRRRKPEVRPAGNGRPGPTNLVCLALMRLESDLDGMIEMLHGDHGAPVFLILCCDGFSLVVTSGAAGLEDGTFLSLFLPRGDFPPP